MDGVGIVGTIFGVIASVAVFVLAYFNNATKLMKRVGDLSQQVFRLQDDVSACKDREAEGRVREAEGRVREAELKGEVSQAMARIRALETATGTVPPPPLAGIVVADLKGTIRDFSPALTPIFQYLPEEITGKPITALVPPDLRPQHELAFARGVADPESIDSGREVLTYGLTKTGTRVPIGITMRGWRAGTEGLITATIRQRLPEGAGSSGVNLGG